MIASTGRVEFLLSRAPLIAPPSGMQHTVMSLIFWDIAGETHERTRIHVQHTCEARRRFPAKMRAKPTDPPLDWPRSLSPRGKQQCRFISARYRASAPFRARSSIFSKICRERKKKKEIEERGTFHLFVSYDSMKLEGLITVGI